MAFAGSHVGAEERKGERNGYGNGEGPKAAFGHGHPLVSAFTAYLPIIVFHGGGGWIVSHSVFEFLGSHNE